MGIQWWRTLVRSVVEECGEVAAFDAFFDTLYRYYALPNEWALFAEVIPQWTPCVPEVFVSLYCPISTLDSSRFCRFCHRACEISGLFDRKLARLSLTQRSFPKSASVSKLPPTKCSTLEITEQRITSALGALGLHALWLSEMLIRI